MHLRPIGSTRGILVAVAAIFLLLHLPFLPSDPASIDGVNFVLGLDDYDVANHQPHPPGAPVFIALAKVSNTLLSPFFAGDPMQNSVRALAIWGVVLGAFATFPLFIFFRELEGSDRRALAATALTLSCPLLWFTASRPMSDVAGLVAAVTVQALAVRVLRTSTNDPRSAGVMRAAALIAGVVMGIRVQSMWLTLPLLVCAAVYAGLRRRELGYLAIAFSMGVLTWIAPLIIISGGPTEYLAAFGAQTADDWDGATLLATNFSLEQTVQALIHTFAYPWTDVLLAATMLGLALVGFGAMLMRSQTAVMLLALAAVPYAIFHLLLQETVHTRYALPLIPAVAYLAVRGVDAISARSMAPLAVALSLTGILLASPSAAAHASTPGPVFRALDDLRQASTGEVAPALAMHHAVTRMLRGHHLPVRTLPSPRPKYEWLELVEHWNRSPNTPVWFLAENGRADFALIDPRSRRLVGSYAWPFPRKFVMSRVPATNLDWFELRPPGWMVGEGWSLSHEAAGIAAAQGVSITERPLKAYLRSRQEAAVLMIGGEILRSAVGARLRFAAERQGDPLVSWDAQPGERSFFHMWHLPAGRLAAPEAYVPVEITAAVLGRPDARDVDVRITQFDLQSEDSIVYGFGAGWYQPEFDGGAPAPWRWTGQSANVHVHAPDTNLVLRLVAEIPIAHVRGRAQISVRAGRRALGQVIAHEREADFTVPIPADALADAAGVITLEIDRTFVPHDSIGNGDRRRLGLRAYKVDLRKDTVSGAATRPLHARGPADPNR